MGYKNRFKNMWPDVKPKHKCKYCGAELKKGKERGNMTCARCNSRQSLKIIPELEEQKNDQRRRTERKNKKPENIR